jgi:hypothetical protein
VLLDRLDPERAITVAARKDNAHGILCLVLGERTKEKVDRLAFTLKWIWLSYVQAPLLDREERVLGQDINAAQLNAGAVLGDCDRHIGVAADDVVKLALSVRAQMRDDHERHSAIGLHASKEAFQRLDAPG